MAAGRRASEQERPRSGENPTVEDSGEFAPGTSDILTSSHWKCRGFPSLEAQPAGEQGKLGAAW